MSKLFCDHPNLSVPTVELKEHKWGFLGKNHPHP